MANLIEIESAGMSVAEAKTRLNCGWSGRMPLRALASGPQQAIALTQPMEASITRFGALECSELPPLMSGAFGWLYAEGYLNPASRQNCSPRNCEWQNFVEVFAGRIWFEGYVVGGRRGGRRIAIDGIYLETAALEAWPDGLKASLESFNPDEREQDAYVIGGVSITRYWWD